MRNLCLNHVKETRGSLSVHRQTSITACVSAMMDETLADDLSTLNQNVSSTSIRYRSLNVHYVRQEYTFRSNVTLKSFTRQIVSIWSIEELSAPTIVSEPVDQQTSILHDFEKEGGEDQAVQPLRNLLQSTPRNVAIVELITSEQRFVHDMQNILKVIPRHQYSQQSHVYLDIHHPHVGHENLDFVSHRCSLSQLAQSHAYPWETIQVKAKSFEHVSHPLSSALMVAVQIDGHKISLGKILGDYVSDCWMERCFRMQSLCVVSGTVGWIRSLFSISSNCDEMLSGETSTMLEVSVLHASRALVLYSHRSSLLTSST